jgi:hypothetical protein
LPKVVESPQEPLGGILVYFNWFLDVPLIIAKANENEVVAVEPDARERGRGERAMGNRESEYKVPYMAAMS